MDALIVKPSFVCQIMSGCGMVWLHQAVWNVILIGQRNILASISLSILLLLKSLLRQWLLVSDGWQWVMRMKHSCSSYLLYGWLLLYIPGMHCVDGAPKQWLTIIDLTYWHILGFCEKWKDWKTCSKLIFDKYQSLTATLQLFDPLRNLAWYSGGICALEFSQKYTS